MSLGLGRRPGTQGQCNHPTPFETILRRYSARASGQSLGRHSPRFDDDAPLRRPRPRRRTRHGADPGETTTLRTAGLEILARSVSVCLVRRECLVVVWTVVREEPRRKCGEVEPSLVVLARTRFPVPTTFLALHADLTMLAGSPISSSRQVCAKVHIRNAEPVALTAQI
jgi:hypothetical protein